MTRIRMSGRDELAIDVDAREVRFPGELAASGSRYGFRVEPPDTWRWANGASLTVDQAQRAAQALKLAGAEEGWAISFAEGASEYRGGTSAYFEFERYNCLRFHRGDGTIVVIPGVLEFESATPSFRAGPITTWEAENGDNLAGDDADRLRAELLQTASLKAVKIAFAEPEEATG